MNSSPLSKCSSKTTLCTETSSPATFSLTMESLNSQILAFVNPWKTQKISLKLCSALPFTWPLKFSRINLYHEGWHLVFGSGPLWNVVWFLSIWRTKHCKAYQLNWLRYCYFSFQCQNFQKHLRINQENARKRSI
jgi:hypothetical protein